MRSLAPFNNQSTMDQILTQKIYLFLQKSNPADEEIVEGAMYLMRISPARYRSLYNSVCKRPKAFYAWVRRELQKQYDIRKRGLNLSDVAEYNNETKKAVEETLSTIPEDASDDAEETSESLRVPILGVRGKREDHDSLPDSIKALWDKNTENWKKIRELHVQLSVMISKPDYQPCDGNELCYLLRQADTDLRNNYALYDSYVAIPDSPSSDTADKVDNLSDNVKAIQKARTTITRNLKEEDLTDKQLQKVQDAVNVLVSLKQDFKPETIERLKAVGISIPDMSNE